MYDEQAHQVGTKVVTAVNHKKNLAKWLASYKDSTAPLSIGMMNSGRTDFQNQSLINIQNFMSAERTHAQLHTFSQTALLPGVVYFAARNCITASWLNNRDQFLWPKDEWIADLEFQTDCFAYTIFHRKNRISHANGVNHWIPYTEQELGLKLGFESRYLADFIGGRLLAPLGKEVLINPELHHPPYPTGCSPLAVSPEAKALLDAGRELWMYYLSQLGVDIDASFYDIRAYFQGRKKDGSVRSSSSDPEYTRLYAAVQHARKHLGDTKIAPKVHEYGFLLS